MTILRVLLVAVLVCSIGGGSILSGQSPQNQEETPTFRSAVEAIQVTAIVTDAAGELVTGLTRDDFEIVENGQPREVSTFSAVDIPIERVELSRGEPDVLGNDGPPGRTYLIALDTMSAENALRTRAFLRQFIEQYFGPNDTAAVVLTTTGLSDSGQEFTSNPRLILEAIDKFNGGDSIGDREKNFMGDFRDLMRFMATLSGARKAMIFVSSSIPGDAYRVMDYRGGRMAAMFSDVHPDFLEALSHATRNNIAIYPIDPGGLTTTLSEPGSFDTSTFDDRDSLAGLAEITGGFALAGSNNYQAAFERLVRENSTYYVLGFNSAEERRDGRYTNIEIRVRRPGLQVRSLEGYVAPPRQAPERRRPPTLLAAVWDAVASAITTSGVPMRMYAAPFRGKGKSKEATVAVTLEIDPTRLQLVEQDGAHRGEIEIVFAMTDSKNKKRWPITRHRAKVALKPETYERVSHSALRVLSQLQLPEGKYQVRASAGGAALAGSVIYDLEVPDFYDDFALSGVALTSSLTRQTFTVSPHEKIDVGFPGPPTTAREFSREDTVTLFAELYENRKKPHTVSLTLELRDESGAVLGAHTVEDGTEEKPKEPSLYAFMPNLVLADIPPGRYSLHLDARSSLDKRKNLTRDIPISVR